MPPLIASQTELIPGYRLIERLGQGGFGEVWKAEAPGGLFKAVKIIHGVSNSHLDSPHLDQELKALQRVKTVRHPFILSLERFDLVDDRLVIVSELADRTLFDRYEECRRQGLPGIPRQELLRYLEEAAEALDLMNAEFNLQHLDIKPQNLFLLYNHVKVGDFGLVKDLEGMFAQITSGVTAVYAAPETFEGKVSRFCDQYNLAITFQELLTGKRPYEGTNGRQLMMQHLMGVPNLAALPMADQPVVGRALSKKPDERYSTCLEFVRALRQAETSGPQEAAADPEPTSTRPTLIDPQEGATPALRMTQRLSSEDCLATPRLRPAPLASVISTASQPVTDKPAASYSKYEPPPAPPERPETTGGGVLMPALVIGLGGLAREVVQQFRKSLRKRNPNETWPHIRLLHVDTDPAGYEHSMRVPDSLLSPEENLVTAFQRPSHYLKRQRDRELLDPWLPLSLLTTVPRGQTTAGGWRALGRLAFVSCATVVATRLRQELQACCDEERLLEVARRSALGLRSSRPRVYVVTSLTGGTGSGMFLDMALAVRHELQQLGEPNAEVVCILLVPAVERTRASRSVANGYAALAELNYFARTAAGKPPFDRCVFLPLPATTDGPAALDECTTLAGDFLCRELTSLLGRTADEQRAAFKPQAAQGAPLGMTCQTFGAYWFSVPRRPLLQSVSRHICDRLVSSWKIRDARALDEAIKSWATVQVQQAGLSAEALAASLRAEVDSHLEQSPGALFEAFVTRLAPGGGADLRRDPAVLPKVVEELTQLLGDAECEPAFELKSPLATALRRATRALARKAEARLAEATLNAVSEPHFRFACKELAAQAYLGTALDGADRIHTRASDEKCRQALDALRQVSALHVDLHTAGWFRAGAKARAAASIVEQLRLYLAMRWDGMVALALGRLFEQLRINLNNYTRSLHCCHNRIDEFLKTFGAAAEPDHGDEADLGLGRYLLPFGCRTLKEAVKRILDSLPSEEESALHTDVRELIRKAFRENVHVCTAPVALFRGLRESIDREVEKVADDSLGRAHAAEAYLEQHADDADADSDLAAAFDEAQPELGGAGRAGFCILAVPPGPEGERFRALVRHALPDVPMHAAASTDDITFYREQPHLCLTDLPQLGPTAREIYQQVLVNEQHGPHSRADVKVW
jgi:serine/threonine protein kinase